MNSKEFWDEYGGCEVQLLWGEKSIGEVLELEELYQHFAERFRRENEERIQKDIADELGIKEEW